MSLIRRLSFFPASFTLLTFFITQPALALPLPATYTYDGDGNRVAKALSGKTTRYVYDGLEVLAEFDESTSPPTLTTSTVHGSGIDEVLAVRDHATGQTLYPLADHLGSPVVLTDAAGQVQATFTYAAFGATRTKTGSGETRFRFTGREMDPESGLYHYRARAYDPTSGRFLQPDPWLRTPADPRLIGMNYVGRLAAVNHPLPGSGFLPAGLSTLRPSVQASYLSAPLGLNAYPYVLNNPLQFMDPFGLEKQKPWWQSLQEGYWAGTGYGEYAAEWYAQHYVETGQWWYYAGGVVSSAWTPETWIATTTTLAGAAAGPRLANAAFRPGGWINRGPWLRVGFGQHQGRRVFRAAGRVIDWIRQRSNAKIDFWRGGPI